MVSAREYDSTARSGTPITRYASPRLSKGFGSRGANAHVCLELTKRLFIPARTKQRVRVHVAREHRLRQRRRTRGRRRQQFLWIVNRARSPEHTTGRRCRTPRRYPETLQSVRRGPVPPLRNRPLPVPTRLPKSAVAVLRAGRHAPPPCAGTLAGDREARGSRWRPPVAGMPPRTSDRWPPRVRAISARRPFACWTTRPPLASTTGTPRATRLKCPTPCGCRARRGIRCRHGFARPAGRPARRDLFPGRFRPPGPGRWQDPRAARRYGFLIRLSKMPPTTIAPAPARCATSAIWLASKRFQAARAHLLDHFVQALATDDIEATRLGQPCQQHARHAVRQPGHVLAASEVVEWHDGNRRSSSGTHSHRHARRSGPSAMSAVPTAASSHQQTESGARRAMSAEQRGAAGGARRAASAAATSACTASSAARTSSARL